MRLVCIIVCYEFLIHKSYWLFVEVDHDNYPLFSLKTEHLLNDEKVLSLFAYLVCAIETVQQNGIAVSRKITSRNKELYITYQFPVTEFLYFENLLKFWDDMLYINERKDSWTDWEIAALEKKFKADITGDGDVVFSEKI